MFIFGKWYPLMAEEGGGEGGDGGNGGGGGGSGPEITPELQAIIDARVGEAVTGLKTKNTELLGKLKATGDQLKSFEGIDPDAVRGILSKFASDEEAQLIAKGDIDTVLAKRADRMKAGFEKDLKLAQDAAANASSRTEKFASRVLKGEVVGAATEAGVHKFAMEDAMLAAARDFELDDDGNPVAREGKYGKDGKPLTLKEWFAEMKDSRPHWFPATGNGGGAGHGGGNGSKVMTQSEFDALPAKQRAAAMEGGVSIKG
ncbi:hypothetical protein JQF37_01990 [Pseudomonas sp. MIL9]|uniref:hypothetical protein n=1 Tax=Pseudomonas sp. MIL9 TaxID=2807620 RepID=UPI001950C698|nr:hypothetical protein [Pseudomonas sp. MIL9]MBM6442397.1 hypothetical protein [Pseudomonas sp. MIL9]